MNICIYGASSATLDPMYYSEAKRLGELIGSAGHCLVYGAGQTGLMGACADGVIAVKGQLLGIAPRYFDQPGILNEQYGELIFTDTMRERKQLMESHSDAIIALPGGIGTFDEFFEMLTLKQLGRHTKPMVLLNTLSYYEPLMRMLQACADGHFMSEDVLHLFTLCGTPEEALAAVENSGPVVQ